MRHGHWNYPGGTIEINVDNKVKDGHHRLHAIIESEVTLLMIVVRGLPLI